MRLPSTAQFAKLAARWRTSISSSMIVTSAAEVSQIAEQGVDGILVIHLSMGTGGILKALSVGKPTAVFASPYSGHEWTRSARCKSSRSAPDGVLPHERLLPAGRRDPAVPRHPSPARGQDPQRHHALVRRTTPSR